MTTSTLITQLSKDIQAFVDKHPNAVLIGIHTGGVWVSQAINKQLKQPLPMGALNISFYRDDFTQVGLHPNVSASDIQIDIANRPVILVDDVLYTGRTVRAAMNELFDFGRPSRVLLAVLIERDGQELPIKADFAGQRMTLATNEYIQVTNDPIAYQIKRDEDNI